MKALKDKKVQLAIVGLVIAVAAAYGITVDQEGLLTVVALLGAVAGGVAGRLAGAVEAQEQVRERSIVKIWDEMEIGSAHIHNQAMDEPFIYPDTIAEADTVYDLAEMAEDIGILNQRVAALEAQFSRITGDL